MSKKQHNPRDSEDRRGRLRPMAALLPGLTKRALGKQGFAAASLITDWQQIVGAELAASTAPIKLAFPRGERTGGTLHLHVSGGGAALELQHMETQIIERLNAHLGYAAVTRLKLVQGGRQKRRVATGETPTRTAPIQIDPAACPAREAIAEIGEPGLRAALERMGASVAARESMRKKRI
jgi:hypothetical protein